MTELEELAEALEQIKRLYPKRGKRISTIVENPYEAGYMPLPRVPKSVAAAGRRLLQQNTRKAKNKRPSK